MTVACYRRVKAALNTDKLQALAGNTLAVAFAYSVMLHVLAVMVIEVGQTLGLWERSLLRPATQQVIQEQKAAQQMVQLPQMEQQIDIPLMFVEVDPAEAAKEPPKNAKYYSSESTVASNPDPKNLAAPKIEGRQDKVPKTMEVMRPDPELLKPAPPPPQKTPPQKKNDPQKAATTPPAVQPEPEPPAKALPNDGDIQVAKAPKPPETQQQKPQPPRPRTLAEAKAQKGIIQGEKMKQEGGVRKHTIGTNLDVKKSPFGSYDAAFIAAVQARWFSLLDERDFVRGQSGRVVLEFRLNKDGRITQMRVGETEVNDTLAWICQRAVLDPSPYKPFPKDLLAEMQRTMRRDYRDVRFTFFYNQ